MTMNRLRASICRVAEGAQQQRDVVTGRMPRSVFDHFEGDDDRRIERVRPARLEVLASIEHESVDAGFERSVIVHQCALPAILVSLSMAENRNQGQGNQGGQSGRQGGTQHNQGEQSQQQSERDRTQGREQQGGQSGQGQQGGNREQNR